MQPAAPMLDQVTIHFAGCLTDERAGPLRLFSGRSQAKSPYKYLQDNGFFIDPLRIAWDCRLVYKLSDMQQVGGEHGFRRQDRNGAILSTS